MEKARKGTAPVLEKLPGFHVRFQSQRVNLIIPLITQAQRDIKCGGIGSEASWNLGED